MDRAAAEAFLAEPRILLLATDRGGKEPFLVAVWHEYRAGRFFIWSAAGGREGHARTAQPGGDALRAGRASALARGGLRGGAAS
jgi:hypothetical protein